MPTLSNYQKSNMSAKIIIGTIHEKYFLKVYTDLIIDNNIYFYSHIYKPLPCEVLSYYSSHVSQT